MFLISLDWSSCSTVMFTGLVSLFPGADPGGGLGGQPSPSLGSFKLEIKKWNKTITEVIFSLIVPILFCQVSHPLPPSKMLGFCCLLIVY